MKCPTDDTTLTMSERGGIEIDYCPECRGVWLDRGELDKLIERSTSQQPAPAAAAPPAFAPNSYEQERDQRRSEQDERYSRAQQFPQSSQPPYGKKKKKESWLSEIFD